MLNSAYSFASATPRENWVVSMSSQIGGKAPLNYNRNDYLVAEADGSGRAESGESTLLSLSLSPSHLPSLSLSFLSGEIRRPLRTALTHN